MASDETPDGLPEIDAEREDFLAGYPGGALLVDAGGAVLATNQKGKGVEVLLGRGKVPEIADLIAEAAEGPAIATAGLTLPGASGDVLVEVTVMPAADDGTLLVLVRDRTIEHNLRSVLVESRQRFKDLVEISSDFAWEVGPDGTFAFVSPRGALGFEAAELVGRRPDEFVLDAEEYAPLPFYCDRPLDEVELWMRRAGGGTACVIVSCLPLAADTGEAFGARGVCRDVTRERERAVALDRARHREQLLNHIVSAVRDEVEPANMLTAAASAAGRALNAAGCRVYRRSGTGAFAVAAEYGTVAGMGALDAILGERGAEEVSFDVDVGGWTVLAATTHYRHTANGAVCMWKRSAAGEWDDDSRILIGDVANQLGIANEQINNHERIVRLSRTDGLTGLLNRRAFYEEELPRRLRRLEHSGETAALFYMDLDNFKAVNDTFGHQRGDEVLLFLRDMLIEYSRPADVIARLGGDEFAMWLDGIVPEATERRAGMLLDKSKALEAFSADPGNPLGLSIGIATYDPGTGEPLDDLLARADAAMYAVKNSGKGGIELAQPFGDNPDRSDDGRKEEFSS